MKLTSYRLALSVSLAVLAISACTQEPIKKAIPAAFSTVQYDHTQRDKVNKQRFINQYQQAYIHTYNKSKPVKKTTVSYRGGQATKRYMGRSRPVTQTHSPVQSARPIYSAIKLAHYNPESSLANLQKVGYNNQTRNLQNTWWQVHQGYRLGNYNHKSKVKRYVRSYSRMPRRLATLSHRSAAYLPSIMTEVRRRRMPSEIALLPFVESAFNTNAYSPAHAAGLWQFIPSTARRYGLPVNKHYDARYNFKASTNAALSYLQDLNREFNGDWLLSLAAYNCGEARVHREIAKNRRLGRPTDFWNLSLPKETRNYVPRLLAFKEVYGNPRAYGIPISYIPSNPKYGRVDFSSLSKSRSTKRSKKYNKKRRVAKRSNKKRNKHRRKVVTHRVRSGETLSKIAKRYRTSVSKIMRMNKLKSTKIRPGKRLKVATRRTRHYG